MRCARSTASLPPPGSTTDRADRERRLRNRRLPRWRVWAPDRLGDAQGTALRAYAPRKSVVSGPLPPAGIRRHYLTWKLRLTGVAAAQLALPACVAWMVQVPTATSVTFVPDTVHTGAVCELKLTVKPELAMAMSVNGAVPNARLERVPKKIVWLPCVTWKLWFTDAAAAQVDRKSGELRTEEGRGG